MSLSTASSPSTRRCRKPPDDIEQGPPQDGAVTPGGPGRHCPDRRLLLASCPCPRHHRGPPRATNGLRGVAVKSRSGRAGAPGSSLPSSPGLLPWQALAPTSGAWTPALVKAHAGIGNSATRHAHDSVDRSRMPQAVGRESGDARVPGRAVSATPDPCRQREVDGPSAGAPCAASRTGAAGSADPGTPEGGSGCSRGIRHAASGDGAPDRIRTCDLWLRRPTLYPTELRALERTALAVSTLGVHRTNVTRRCAVIQADAPPPGSVVDSPRRPGRRDIRYDAGTLVDPGTGGQAASRSRGSVAGTPDDAGPGIATEPADAGGPAASGRRERRNSREVRAMRPWAGGWRKSRLPASALVPDRGLLQPYPG